MSHVNIDKKRALSRWKPILEQLNITSADKQEWMAEYAEYHNLAANQGIVKESMAYATQHNVMGMGPVISPGSPGVPGVPGAAGSGDLGQSLLPVAMKIAAQTIGLDLVATKPTPGPVIDLAYFDIRYDDTDGTGGSGSLAGYEKPTVFMVTGSAALTNRLKLIMKTNGIVARVGGLSKRMFVKFQAAASGPVTGSYSPDADLATSKTNRAVNATNVALFDTPNSTSSKQGILEFLGFSRINNKPMFRAFRQTNFLATNNAAFDTAKNSFVAADTILTVLAAATLVLTNATFVVNGANTDVTLTDPDGTAVIAGTYVTSGAAAVNVQTASDVAFGATDIELVSALEDQIPGFSANWNRTPMDRGQDDQFYPGNMAPNMHVKRVAVGTIEVSSALKRNEIEDIKAQTGIDVVQKMEGALVNELSQVISKQIVEKIFEMGEQNRLTTPFLNDGVTRKFDFSVSQHMAHGSSGWGETSHAVARKLVTRLRNASNYMMVDGRIGTAQYMVTNGNLASAIADNANYSVLPTEGKFNAPGQLHPAGQMYGMTIYVDPYMSYSDNRIVLGRKNNPDQPGLIFVPYLMAQSISLISEATFAPRIMLRSRYAIAEVGFYPWKQYLSIHIEDNDGLLG